MISIIIPSYKNAKCLDICLNSIIHNQKYNNEIIVVIDGFVQQYSELKNKYNKEVKFFDFEENQGMPQALNIGVYNATNQYILIINDDNVLCKD